MWVFRSLPAVILAIWSEAKVLRCLQVYRREVGERGGGEREEVRLREREGWRVGRRKER